MNTETQTGNAKLFQKIASVMSKVRTLEKSGRNTFDKYDYVTADAIAIRIGAAMAEVGLAFLPSMVGVETSEFSVKSGATNFRTVVTMQMILACAETGATWASMWSGEAIDRSDKSISKAAVSATKYFLLKTFLLAGGDEEDADASSPVVETQRHAPQKGNTPAAQTEAQHDDLWEPEPQPHETPPHQRLFGQLASGFGPDADAVRPWLLKKWTKLVSPANVRSSATELSDTEKDMLADYIKEHLAAVQRAWNNYKAAQVQSTAPRAQQPVSNGVAA